MALLPLKSLKFVSWCRIKHLSDISCTFEKKAYAFPKELMSVVPYSC